RAFLQKELPAHFDQFPKADPLSGIVLPPIKSLPKEITNRWPVASATLLAGDASELAALPIDHSVPAVEQRGGAMEARRRLAKFLDQHLYGYAAGANDPDKEARSGLSPYLHFGHISPHEMFHELMSREEWSPGCLGPKTGGKREGWWGTSPGAESWLDPFITWRELGYNMSSHRDNYEDFDSLPDWAQATLDRHSNDPRLHVYSLDGRNPNSYSGIFWVLGRYDRPWGPERPIFGFIRYMSSENTYKKIRVREYLSTYARAFESDQ
ncbi:MAG TPA: deoxyribodipyrimidine photolyase, partial [Planctomycetaceae bacterium]|nr:deoxyribodipyrimidine photolyase [Planctomycetaceae bacterium]